MIEGFVPFVHVQDVDRSVAFYEQFGFELRNTYRDGEQLVWCWLERHGARLMLARADGPVDAGQQAVLFYLYVDDLEGLHARLDGAGPIEPGAPGPDRQFGIQDPDGYVLMVTDTAALVPPTGRP
jgi:predicted enzyme related to lactoylglutathione lyase